MNEPEPALPPPLSGSSRKRRMFGPYRPAVFLAFTVLALVALTLLPLELRVGGVQVLKKIDLLARYRKPGNPPGQVQSAIVSVPESGSKPERISGVPGSISPAAETPRPTLPPGPDPLQSIEVFETDALDHFFRALRELPQNEASVRIAYYGDSIVEGDLLTMDLRLNLQKAFGGSGVGYLPITSEVAQFRISVGHTFSSEWKSLSVLSPNRQAPVGISGQVFIPGCQPDENGKSGCSSWVEYKAVKAPSPLSGIRRLSLFYSHVEAPAAADFALDELEPQSVDLEPGPEVHHIVIDASPSARRARITFRSGGAFNVYGASLEGEKGVLLDNFALRGNSGLPLKDISSAELSEFARLLPYKLIIFHFGVNVSAPENFDFSWYEYGLQKVIRHFQAAFPETSFLLISCPDRSYKDGLEYVTIPNIPTIVECQRRAAQKTGIAFWDMYSAMGGMNSMVRWVNHTPSLAALDYTHFNYLGAKRLADDLTGALLDRKKAFEETRVP